MEVIIKLNSQAAGRDKLARVVQYTSRLVWAELQKKNSDRYTIDQIKRLESTCSSFRKLLRFGRCIDSFYSVLSTVNYPDYVLRTTLTISKLCNTLFLFADHVLWLARSGFLKNVDSNKWSDISNRYWLLSILMNLIRDAYEIFNVLQKERDFVFANCSTNISAMSHYLSILNKVISVVKLRRDVMTDAVKNLCDIWIPLNALGRVKLQPSTIGFLGAVSSLAGLLVVLQPRIKLSPS